MFFIFLPQWWSENKPAFDPSVMSFHFFTVLFAITAPDILPGL